jgi:hypothetical protein
LGLFYVPFQQDYNWYDDASGYPGDSPDGADLAPGSRVLSEPSSIQPLPPSLWRPSPSAQTGHLRIQVGRGAVQVYVDGFYVGTVEDVDRSSDGLNLPPGWHRLEFRAPGYATSAANVTIELNRTIDYRADLTPLQR